MNLLFVLYIGFDQHGPSVHLLKHIIKECLVRGHHVYMIVRNRGGNDPDIPIELQDFTNLKCEIIYDNPLKKNAFVNRYFNDIHYAYKCRQIYKNYKNIDAVFLQSNTTPYFAIRLLKRTLHAPILFNVQNIFPIDAGILHKLPIKGLKGIPYKILRKMQRDAYLMSDSLVTISDDMRQTLIDEKVPEKKIIVIYNWSYSDDPNDILDEENLFLKAHPEVKDFFRVVFAGNIGAMVNPNIIAEAAEKLKHYERIKFIMIGDGNNLPRLKELSKEKKLSNMIFFPYQPEEFAPHNYAMAHVNINALPKGIIKTCMPSKTATMLNSAKPMVVAVDLNSEYSKLLQRIDKCSVVDWNDNEGFASSIKNIYLSSSKQKSNNSRLLFVNYCSTKNAKQYLETLIDISKKN